MSAIRRQRIVAKRTERLACTDSLVMVHGPQGGWHMLGSVYLENTQSVVEVEFTITDLISEVVVASNF